MFTYRANGTLLWQVQLDGGGLAGPLSFTADGNSFAVVQGWIVIRGGATGTAQRSIEYQQVFSRMPDQPSNFAPVRIAGWEGDTPLVTVSDGVIRLSSPPQWLLRAPVDARDLQVATDRVRWSGREPGPPDPGPAFDWYRPIINVAGGGALTILVAALFWWRRRRLREDEHAEIRVV
jgi:hypothetical protein